MAQVKKKKRPQSNSIVIEKPKKKKASNDDVLLRDLVKRTDDFYDDFNESIERARNYLTFLYVDQWEAEVRRDRETMGRPTMQFNKLTSIIRACLGDDRSNSPAATIRGVGKKTTQAQVDLYDGLCRQIAYDSDADIVYQIALKAQMECGWGSARVVAEYENENSFHQILKVLAIQDYQTAFWDPTAQMQDKSDGDYCGVYTIMSLDHFKKVHPDIEDPESAIPEGINYFLPWNSRDSIIVAEIYYKEYEKKKIVQLSDGNTVEPDEAEEILQKQATMMRSNPHYELMGYEPLEIVNEREAECYKIKHVKFIRNAVIARTDYPGKILPIPYAEGDAAVIDGRRIPIPFVQDAIDAQKLINYVGSEIAYAMLRARKETVWGTPENFAGFEDEWQDPDTVQGPLLYNLDSDGQKPELITPPAFNLVYQQQFQSLTQEIYNILGWGDESRGLASNAVSGTAIAERKESSKMGVNIYYNNNARLVKSVNRILLDMIPHIYDAERTVMVMGRDGKSKPIDINKRAGLKVTDKGDYEDDIENNMKDGSFSVQIKVEGSYDSQQIASMNCFIQLAQVNPAIANLIPDLMAEVSGLENTQQLVERLKTLIPPEVLAKEAGLPPPPAPPPPPPDPQMMIEQGRMQLEMKDQQLKASQQALDEQKLMQDSQNAGLNHQATLAKAGAEIQKAGMQRDVAVLDHATKIHEHMTKLSNP